MTWNKQDLAFEQWWTLTGPARFTPEFKAGMRFAWDRLSAARPVFLEIGKLYRERNGSVVFWQKDEEMEFPVHTAITVYTAQERPIPQESSEK